MKNNKIHIDIRDDIEHCVAVERMLKVMQGGRVSKDNTEYCWSSAFSDGIVVAVRDYRKSDCFVVYKDKRYDSIK